MFVGNALELVEGLLEGLQVLTAYRFDAYRVHIADENDPANPVYELRPYSEYQDSRGLGLDFSEPYTEDHLAAEFPLFLKDMDYFPERYVDPPG